MNCEEYRKAISAEPSFDGGAAHLSECGECQEFRKSMLALDQDIAAALAIGVPALVMPELPEIVADNVVALGPRRRIAPAWYAMAATVLVAVVVAFRLLGTGVVYESLEEEILAHVDHDPGALVVSDQAVSDNRLDQVVPVEIASLGHSAGLVTYAQTCPINGKDVPHLVIQGQRGPVTILLMPDEKIETAVDLSGEHISGVLLPVGSGSIAIIGDRDEPIEAIKQSVLKSVTWDT